VEVPDYDLPERAIAQTPVEPRDSARLLDGLDPFRPAVHRRVRDLPELVGPGDVVVVNDSRVIPARLRLAKVTGGAAEVLLLEPDPADPAGRAWTALVRPGRRLPPGTRLHDPDQGEPMVDVGDRLGEDGRRRIRFLDDPRAVMDRCGEPALPPYIHVPLEDPDRYQTVYAARPGSVAAPTAGLHLTPEVIGRIGERGADVRRLDLQVGLATFRPMTAEKAEDHVMHTERYSVPGETWEACRRARRVIAVGTTTVRALESAGATGELAGTSDLFVRPGFPFSVVDVLLTNFHMPRSTLLLLLEAFAGPRWRDLYRTALAEGYRFLSFGDAMIVGRA
jgi:S-adenosylmethionine:tRNA ribosyltransferase-isomerase